MTVTFEAVNDKPHYLFLDGDNNSANYAATFIEESDPVLLSQNLRIEDEDVGERTLYGATVTVIDSEFCTLVIL